jgi:hypothetical protein
LPSRSRITTTTLALARLIHPQPAIPAVLDTVRRLDIATKIAAIDFGLAALAAHIHTFHLGRHRFAHLMRQDESRHIARNCAGTLCTASVPFHWRGGSHKRLCSHISGRTGRRYYDHQRNAVSLAQDAAPRLLARHRDFL